MLAITPLAISCLITSMGLVAIRSASSRTVMLAGISMTLWPFSLMTHLRQGPAGASGRIGCQPVIARRSAGGPNTPASAFLPISQAVPKGGQRLPLIRGQVRLEGTRQRPAQARIPTRPAVVQVGPAAGGLA